MPYFDPRRTCLHLRSKQMFYECPEEAAQKEPPKPGADTTVYWCQCTQTGRGPDEEPANHAACTMAARRCFQGFASLA